MELWRKRSARKTENLEVGVRLPEVPPLSLRIYKLFILDNHFRNKLNFR